MPFLEPNRRLLVSTLDGWSDFVLGQPLAFATRSGRLLRCRVGATTDGLSSPKFVKCDLQNSCTFFPAVAHDGAYRGDLEESFDKGVTWSPAKLSKVEADDLLLELLEDNGVPGDTADIIYEAVAKFGQSSWDADEALREAPKG